MQWPVEASSRIVGFAGPLPARTVLQVARCFANDPACRSVAQNGELVITGSVQRGANTEWRSFCAGQKYDSYARVWSPLPLSRSLQQNGSLSAAFGRFLYVFGGQDPHTDLTTATVTRLDLSEGDTWEVRSPMLIPRIDAGSVAFAGSFYILGGSQDTGNPMVRRVLNSVERYSPSSDEWQLLPPMLQPRMDPRGVAVIGGCLYIVDGVCYGSDGGKR